jgi:anti-anti-sigma factor
MLNDSPVALRQLPQLTVMDIAGQVTGASGPTISEAYRAACTAGATNILLNFAAADYIDSTGVSYLIRLLMDARGAQRQVLVTGLTDHYRKIFDMMGLSRYAPIFETEEAAAQSLTAEPH